MTDFSSRDIGRLETAVEKLSDTVDRFADRMAETYVPREVHERDLALVEEKQTQTQNQVNIHARYFNWIVTTILGALILGGVGLLFATQHGGIH